MNITHAEVFEAVHSPGSTLVGAQTINPGKYGIESITYVEGSLHLRLKDRIVIIGPANIRCCTASLPPAPIGKGK